MTKRMLIDTTHAEETRVVVLDGNRLEDYDVETSAKKQLKGNIYLAKIIRVEPSLQAAFVEYGGNRHGFLAFSEIHPDYYQIPVADRERLIALQEEEARAEEAREEAREQASGPDDDAQHDEPGRNEPGRNELGRNEPGHDAAALDASGDEPFRASEPDQPSEAADGNGLDDAGPDEREAEVSRETSAPETVGGENDGGDDGRGSPQSSRFLRQYKIQEVIRRRQILLIQVVKEERGNKGAALTTYISLAGRFCVLMPNSLRGGGVSRKITSAADRRRLKEITTELEIPRGMAMIIRTAGAQRPRPEIRRDCEYLLRLWDDIREHTLRAMAPALINEEANLIKRAIRDVYTRDIEEIAVDGEQGWKAAREFMRNLMPANAQKVILWRDQGQPLFSYYQVEHHLDSMLQPTVQLRSGGYLVINQTEALVAIDVNSGRSTRERGIEETALRTNLEAADEVARQLRLRDLAGLIVIDFIDMEARRHNVMVERRLKEALKNDRARIQLGTISHFGLMEMSRQRLRPSIAESSFVACAHCAGTGFVRGTDSAALHVLRAIEEEGGRQRAAEILVYAASAVSLYVLNHKRVWLAEIEQRHRMTVNFATDDSLIPPEVRIEKIRPQVAAPAVSIPTLATSEVAAERHLPANGVVTHGIIERFEADAADEDPADPIDLHEFQAPEMLQDNVPSASAKPDAAEAPAESGEDEHKRKRRRRRRRGGRREDGNRDEGSREDGDGAEAAALPPQDDDQPDIEHAGIFAQPPAQRQVAALDAGTGQDRIQEDPSEMDQDDELPLHGRREVPLSEEQGMAPRKRGRRGGARGRKPREPNEAARDTRHETGQQDGVQPAADQGPAPYDGPTPANPFGAGSYDIFDMIEQDADLPRPPAQAAAPEPAPVPETEPPLPELPFVEPQPEEATAELPLELPTQAVPEAAAPETEVPVAAEPEAAAKPKRKRATSPRAKKTEAPAEPVPAESMPAEAMPAEAVSVEPVPEEPSLGEPVPAPKAAAPKARSKAAASKAAAPAAAIAKVRAPRLTKARKAEQAALDQEAQPEAAAQPAAVQPQPVVQPAPEPVAAESVPAERPGNIVQPTLIGESESPPARRTGWWKR